MTLYRPGGLPSTANDGDSKLIFNCMNDACALVGVWDASAGVGLRLPLQKNRNRAADAAV